MTDSAALFSSVSRRRGFRIAATAALIAATALAAVPGLAVAQTPAPQAPAAGAIGTQAAVVAASPMDENAAQYCNNIANAAADARFARQAQTLKALEAEIDKRVAALEQKRAEYQEWLDRREAFLKKADESLVAIYSQMRPDAAAAQLTAMSDEAAASIVAKLQPRAASAILNEMDAAKAAQVASYMSGLTDRQTGKKPPTTGMRG
ncbi:Flagellar motility protein MotE, a chaperone for MotC folding [Pseudoxanthobacter soli DSM 19599]|uniref:Flagellar motility protein MotE, a chaperone for MotC folding n=1 Tax=Pseudoxanthobacter soli DSM 19599 TaxID=1123029 RepID=A0A1M7ZED1_9HYPH|nr:MotE family protein [Pseudoxanthobacter soli]SHO63281.1 Flagellar motility protein MotE, a chaperone for MotC folding [Pseudoxanthobacter soli DSM 19599]